MLLLLAQMLERRGFLFFYSTANFLEHALRDSRIKERLSAGYGFERLYQVVAADLLQDVARSAGADGREQHLVLGVGCEHDDFHVWMFRDDLLAGFDP